MMQADPVFAQGVKESEEAFQILQLARQRELRQKLKNWDLISSKSNNRKKKGLLLALVLILLCFSSWCWLSYYYSPVHQAQQSFNSIQSHFLPELESPFVSEKWNAGTNAFKQEDFENAMLIFISIRGSVDSLTKYQCDWNILLCQFALNGPTARWEEDLVSFSKQAPMAFQSSAEKLLKTIRSPFYTRWYKSLLKKSVSSVKPKII